MNTIDDIDHDPRYQILRQAIASVERAAPGTDGSFWAATDELLAGVAWHELRDDIYEARSWLSSLAGDESADRARHEGDTLEVLCNLWFAIEQLRGDDGLTVEETVAKFPLWHRLEKHLSGQYSGEW